MSIQQRHPAGVPVGGQFASHDRAAAGLALSDTLEPAQAPEVLVTVQWQYWNDRDQAVDLDSETFDIGPLIAETEPGQRITDFGDPSGPGGLDHVVWLAQERGLIDNRSGPFDVSSNDLEDLVRRGELEDVPRQRAPKIIPGVPLSEPLTVQDVLAEADEDGFVTATLTVDLDDLVDAAKAGTDYEDEHDFLAAKVSMLLPYDSSYTTRGMAEDGSLLIDFTSNVREAAATQRFNQEDDK